ncbi:hypothetical protein ACEPAH_283 [Sanghuangporus vaninii]
MPEVSLRVLYTVNTSQYILAKAPQKVPLLPVDSSSSSCLPVKHGRASLKACALAICRSSPELSPDAAKDFSFYILDPLEDIMSKNRHGQSGGVAVGMGLLSTILSPYAPDTTMVTGTLVDCGQNEDALEVVVSLRQVAPAAMHAVPDQPHNVSCSERTKINSRRTTGNQPYLTFNPLPLPSFNERLSVSQAQLHPHEIPKGTKEPRKPNPTHATRAHQLPTPYIGPPKRRYSRAPERNKGVEKENISSRGSTSEPWELPSSQSSEDINYDGSLESTSSDTLPSSDAESIDSSSTIRPYGTTEAPDIPESAVMLAALSSVSSDPTNTSISSPQGSLAPSPELVSFLRAYLAYAEAQQKQPSSAPNPVSNMDPPPLESTEQAIVNTVRPDNESDPLEDKENQKPRPEPPIQNTKDSRSKSAGRLSPLGSARINVGATGAQSKIISDQGDTKRASASGNHMRKRKLSDATFVEEASQTRRVATSVSQTKPSAEDLSGVRLNRGWGGLRVRSDGTLWGEKPPIASSEAASSSFIKRNEQPFVFRSSRQDASVDIIRKGPYVLPDWAKGVPPPAPPLKADIPGEGNSGGNRTRSKKQSKSKSFSRLGGKGAMRRTVSMPDDGRPLDQSTLPVSSSRNALSIPENTHTSPRSSPGKAPIIAYTSPIGKSRLATLFQAFRTSPLRPSVHKTPPATLLKSAKRTPSDSATFSSLFTPTPSNTRTAPGVKPRQLFAEDEEEDMPPSPTPTKRNTKTSDIPTAIKKTSLGIDMGTRCGSLEGESELPSSLPIASSDDVLASSISIQTSSIRSDSSVMNFGKIHDWSSLDLPPSSPPPPSSPSIVPVDGSDLPSSDIPSSDSSEVDSPAVASEIENSNHPSPAENGGQSNFLTTFDNAVHFGMNMDDNSEYMNVPNLDDPFASLFNLTGEEGPSQTAAFEALQNGLGQEDFSEGWNFLNSLFTNVPPDLRMDGDSTNNRTSEDQHQSWLSVTSDQVLDLNYDADHAFGSKAETAEPSPETCGDQDPASLAATNLQDLLQGCLV